MDKDETINNEYILENLINLNKDPFLYSFI